MSKVICERFESLAELSACGRCEHVKVCASYEEHMDAEVSRVCSRYLDYV
ncbi:MAG: hypothetical protein H7843_13940 [Nitrospirota bacterium]